LWLFVTLLGVTVDIRHSQAMSQATLPSIALLITIAKVLAGGKQLIHASDFGLQPDFHHRVLN